MYPAGFEPLSEVEIADDWQVLGLLGTGSKSLILHDVFVPEHRCVMVSDLFAGTPPGALVHPDYPVLRAPRGFLVSYSLPPVAIALGRRALDIACATLAGRVSRGVTRVAESEVVQMAIGEAAAAIDVATLLLHTRRESSTAAVNSGRKNSAFGRRSTSCVSCATGGACHVKVAHDAVSCVLSLNWNHAVIFSRFSGEGRDLWLRWAPACAGMTEEAAWSPSGRSGSATIADAPVGKAN